MPQRPSTTKVIAPAEVPLARKKAVRERKAAGSSVAQKKSAMAPKLRLLNSAMTAFAERGFAGARIDQIARKAQINKQLIYHYFGGKKELYDAVLTHMVGQLYMREEALRDDLDGEANRILEQMYELLRNVQGPAGRQWIRLLMFEALETGGIHLEEPRRRTYRRGVKIVEAAQEKGEIDLVFDAGMLRLALFGLTIVPTLLPQIARLTTGQDFGSPEFVRRWTELLTEVYSRLGPRAGTPKR